MSNLKFDSTPVDFYSLLKSRIEKRLPPGQYYPEDVLNAAIAVNAEALAQNALYQKYLISSATNPYIATKEQLNFIGSFVGIDSRLSATSAYAIIQVKRDPLYTAKILPQGTQFSLDGSIFATDEDLAIDKDTVQITCISDGLLSINPTEAVMTDNNISFEQRADILFFTDGRNNESDDEFRSRIINAFRNPQYFPNKDGYVSVLKDLIPGIRACNIVQQNSALYFYPIFDQSQFPPYGIPTQDALDVVSAAIASIQTFGLESYFVLAPTPSTINISITGLNPDTQQIREELTTRIAQYFSTIMEPGVEYIGTDLQRTILTADFTSINSITPAQRIEPSTPGEFFILGSVSFSNTN